MLRRRHAADEAKAPVEHVRELLQGFFADADSLGEVRDGLSSIADARQDRCCGTCGRW